MNAVHGVEGGCSGTEARAEPVTCFVWTKEELREVHPLLQPLTTTNCKLVSVYGDAIHQNNGTRLLNIGIEAQEDNIWQRLHKRLVLLALFLYDLPNSHWANRFLNLQTKLWREVRERKCNLKTALDFLPCTIF